MQVERSHGRCHVLLLRKWWSQLIGRHHRWRKQCSDTIGNGTESIVRCSLCESFKRDLSCCCGSTRHNASSLINFLARDRGSVVPVQSKMNLTSWFVGFHVGGISKDYTCNFTVVVISLDSDINCCSCNKTIGRECGGCPGDVWLLDCVSNWILSRVSARASNSSVERLGSTPDHGTSLQFPAV